MTELTTESLSNWLGLTEAEIAALIDGSSAEFACWCKHEIDAAPGVDAVLGPLAGLVERLRATFSSAQATRDWMQDPNRYLGGIAPVDEVRAGRLEHVQNALEVIDWGIHV